MVCDSKLVVLNNNGPNVFQIFPLPLDGSSFGAGFKGRGPNEFLQIDRNSLQVKGEGIQLADADGSIKLVKFCNDKVSVESTRIVKTPSLP